MTFDQLLVFHKIIELGSFKAAAAELHRTQPAISFAIKKLEEELEVDLFDRTSYRPLLTAHGHSLHQRSQKIIMAMLELEALKQSFSNKQEPELEVSLDGVCVTPRLLKFFKSFSDQFPHTKINLSFDILAGAERKILLQQSVIGITHFVHDRQLLEVYPLTKVRMLPVMATELFRERQIKQQSDLQDIEQIVVGDGPHSKGPSFGLLEGGKKWHLSDSKFKQDIILSGLGWGHLPESAIEREVKEKKLKVLQFEDIHPRDLEVNLIRLKRRPLGPVASQLWDLLKAFYQE
jgi:DNA-binding transcriptional LysR family regulator